MNPPTRAFSGQCARSDDEPAIDEHVLDAGGVACWHAAMSRKATIWEIFFISLQ
jgi:hypothetical protein